MTKIEVKATGKYLRLSVTKVNRVLEQIRGKSYQEAKLILQFMPYRSCDSIAKILDSAVSNAEHNHGLEKKQLSIQSIFVNQGPKMKRFQPRAQGRAFPIHKPTCHITVILAKNNTP
uniref:Large ribosomal subunit protein uL22c n=1 Tax=Helminthora furcellata TaxID=1884666 RepID=A0A1G4NZG6_9FLOR|nr:Ribosomal protein L22 [Helminthora furcellata]SCW21185.1 Ribosomal protein L22 [Helminthora furcellata]SCW24045.1 Ribosomal protein L22 [Helminthora furcellata]